MIGLVKCALAKGFGGQAGTVRELILRNVSCKVFGVVGERAAVSTVAFSRAGGLAAQICALVRELEVSLDAALYRFNNAELAQSLAEAAGRWVQIRLVLDVGKYHADAATRQMLENYRLPFRLLHGRRGAGSKMHHKFAILDRQRVITGSYNWTSESEQENYEALLIAQDLNAVRQFQEEFEALWDAAAKNE